jgi:exopolysaccharide biosynthesis polyprenyl glycosylphosphotransferase
VAVIAPPSLLYAASILLVTAVHARLAWPPSGWTLLRASVLTAMLIPIVHVVRVILTARGTWSLRLGLLPSAVLLALLLDTLLPGERVTLPVLATLLLCATCIQPLAWAWRMRWLRQRPRRVTLVASSEIGAFESIAQLEAIPGLVITNALVPGCNPSAASRVVRRPVFAALPPEQEDAGLEHTVVVSCPQRDRAVSSVVARLVARGHVISSESHVLRRAEGRVDTTRADALNLVMSRPSQMLASAASRLLDLGVAATLLVLAAPVMLVIAWLVHREDGGPVFYRQVRVGAGGRLIGVLKFRSMRVDAESHSGPVWAQEDDPRVTRVGRVLRHFRLDELPQLLNVLAGDMALVGPRPERPHFTVALREEIPLFELRTIVRPGITGWAQVRAAYAAGVEAAREKLGYDLYYVLHRSPWLDLAILFDTVGIAFSGRGSR